MLTASGGWSQGPGAVVEARAVVGSDAAHANSPLKLAVVAQVADGYHINDHKPSLNYLIPTDLKFEPNDVFSVKSVVYPKGTPVKFSFSDLPLSVYEGKVVVGALLQSAKIVHTGNYVLSGRFSYQACNDHACLPPASVPFSVNIKVVPRTVHLKPVDPDVFQRINFE